MVIIPFVISLLGCTSHVTRPTAKGTIERKKAHEILNEIKEQDRKVTAFFSTGKIFADAWYGRNEADILIIGTRNPLKVKIEITHSWGQPILHLLFKNSEIQVISFKDRKSYSGSVSSETFKRFFQIDISPHMFWSVLRAYPSLLDYNSLSIRPNLILLHDRRHTKEERIFLSPEALFPRAISYRDKNLEISFGDFREKDRTSYAGEVIVSDRRNKLVIRNERMVFDKDIPPEVFMMEIPPGFSIYNLDAPDN